MENFPIWSQRKPKVNRIPQGNWERKKRGWEGLWGQGGGAGGGGSSWMEEETRPGSSHLPTLQTDKVDLYQANKTINFCSERMRRRRRKVCRSTMSAASHISPLAGSTPPCGKPSGYPLTSVKDMTAFQRVLFKLGTTHPTSHIWQLPERFRCSGWPCPHGLIRHHWTRRCSEERKEIWTDLGGGEAEMWEQFSKAFTQQVFLVTKISISNPTEKLFSLNCFMSFQPKKMS